MNFFPNPMAASRQSAANFLFSLPPDRRRVKTSGVVVRQKAFLFEDESV
jgi:hypothetical protein